MKALGLLIAFAVFATGYAATLNDYVKLRSSFGVKQAVGIDTLNAFVGQRVLEVSGRVKGTIRVGDGGTIMLETSDGMPIPIDTPNLPEFLLDQGDSMRFLIRANRPHESARLEAELLGVVPENQIRAWEKKNAPKPTAKPSTTRRASTTPSRSRNTPRPMPGRLSSDPAREWNLSASDATPYYAAYIRKVNSRLSSEKATRIAEGVIGFSLHYGVDARLVMALLMAESNFNPNARSHVGAMGLGQLMPGTARELGVSNAYNTTENLYGTVKLLSRHIQNYSAKTGDDFEALTLALAAYNAGPGAVKRHGGVPPYRETQNYVRKVISYYRQLCGE